MNKYESLAKLLAGKGVRIRYVPGTPRTDGKTIYLPADYEMKPGTDPLLLSAIPHEAEHIRSTVFQAKRRMQGLLEMYCLEALEDIRINQITFKRFANARAIYHENNRIVVESQKREELPTLRKRILHVLLAGDGCHHLFWDKESIDFVSQPEVEKIIRYAQQDAKSTWDLVVPAAELARILKQYQSELEQKSLESNSAKSEKSEEKSEKSEGSEKSEKSEQSEEKSEKSEKKLGQSEKSETQSKKSEESEKPENGIPAKDTSNKKINLESEACQEYRAGQGISLTGFSACRRFLKKIQPVSLSSIVEELKNYIRQTVEVRRTEQHQRLHLRNLYAVHTGEVEKLLDAIEHKDTYKLHLTYLLDTSSSMYYESRTMATMLATAQSLENCFQSLNEEGDVDIRTRVYTFDTNIKLVKLEDEPFPANIRGGGCTSIVRAFIEYVEALPNIEAEYPRHKKVLICLTDAYISLYQANYIKKIIQTELSGIGIIPIIIGSERPIGIFQVNLERVEDLPEVLIQAIAQFV